jgi:hypothetical protein
VARHVLRVDSSHRTEPRYGFFLGTNAVVRGIRRTRSNLHRHVSTGRLSELLSVVVMLWRLLRRRVERDPVLSPVSVEFCRDGGHRRQAAQVLLMAMSVQKAILGIRPLRRGQRAGLAVLSWPDYRLAPWIKRFLTGRLDDFNRISLRGDFEWILDGEMHRQKAGDGALTITVDRPAHFLRPET